MYMYLWILFEMNVGKIIKKQKSTAQLVALWGYSIPEHSIWGKC